MVHLLLESLVALAQDEVVVNLPDERLVLINPQLRKERFSDLREKGYRLKYCIGSPPGTKTFLPSLYDFFCHLVDIADNDAGKEDLREGDGHGVDSGDHRGVHEVDGVAVEEDGCTAHGHADYHRPEYVLEAW